MMPCYHMAAGTVNELTLPFNTRSISTINTVTSERINDKHNT